MRPIDADALIDFIDCGHLRNPLQSCFSERDVVDMLESRPTIEPTVVHGKWVVDECDTTDDVPSSAWIDFHCSECNMDYGLDEGQYGWCREEKIPYNFCPNCGADMREDKPCT